MNGMDKAQRAAGRETSAPHTRQVGGPDNPGASVVRCAMPVQDALADANTLRKFVVENRRPASAVAQLLALVGREGSRAVVAALDGQEWAGADAEAVAHAAFRLVPGLRG